MERKTLTKEQIEKIAAGAKIDFEDVITILGDYHCQYYLSAEELMAKAASAGLNLSKDRAAIVSALIHP